MAVFVTADTHFNFESIVGYEGGYFHNIQERDEAIIQRYNEEVGKSDTCYFLGDFGFGSQNLMRSYLSRLNGTKILVAGNHDMHYPPGAWYSCGFQEIAFHPIVVDEFLLSHRPFLQDCGALFNLFGHVHNDPQYETFSEHGMCVCCCRHDFRPVPFARIRANIVRSGILVPPSPEIQA